MDKIYSKLDEDICTCGHNIQEHEAVHDCKCYVYGCECDGFQSPSGVEEDKDDRES